MNHNSDLSLYGKQNKLKWTWESNALISGVYQVIYHCYYRSYWGLVIWSNSQTYPSLMCKSSCNTCPTDMNDSSNHVSSWREDNRAYDFHLLDDETGKSLHISHYELIYLIMLLYTLHYDFMYLIMLQYTLHCDFVYLKIWLYIFFYRFSPASVFLS